MKKIFSIIISILLILPYPLASGEASFLAPLGVTEYEEFLYKKEIAQKATPTIIVPKQKVSFVIESINAIEELIGMYRSLQKKKWAWLNRLTGNIEKRIAQKIGDMIVTMEESEQDMIKKLLRPRVQMILLNPGMQENPSNRIMVSIYKYVCNFSLRRQTIKGIGSTVGTPIPSPVNLSKLGTLFSLYLPFITSYHQLSSKIGRFLWKEGEYGSAIAYETRWQGRRAYANKRYPNELDMRKLVLDGGDSYEDTWFITNKDIKKLFARSIFGTSFYTRYLDNKKLYEWGMPRSVFKSEVQHWSTKDPFGDSFPDEIDEDFSNYMSALAALYNSQAQLLGYVKCKEAQDVSRKIKEAQRILHTTIVGTKIKAQIDKVISNTSHREKQSKHKLKNKTIFWLDKMDYLEAHFHRIMRSDEYSVEFWLSMEIQKEAESENIINSSN